MTSERYKTKIIKTDITNSGDKYTVYVLLKFGQEKYLRDFLNRGILYFSSKQSLRGNINEHSDNYRYDSLEGATLYESHGPGIRTFTISETGEEINIPTRRIIFQGQPLTILGNIISFYGITDKEFTNNELIQIDPKMKEFGSHFILIYDFEHFMRRISAALDKLKLKHSFGKVEYFDEENHKGELHYYHKRSSLGYQKEFRIHLERHSTRPFKLKVGNLKEFAVICHSDTLEYLKIKLDRENQKFNINYLKPSK